MKKILRAFLYLAASICLASTASAQTAQEYFMLGNNAYKAGDYQRAAENYESALKNGFVSAELYYNLANSFAKLDKTAHALLNYKRAVYHAPRMREDSQFGKFAKDNSRRGLSKSKPANGGARIRLAKSLVSGAVIVHSRCAKTCHKGS